MALAPIFAVLDVESSMSYMINRVKRPRLSTGTMPARAAATPPDEVGPSTATVEIRQLR